MGKNGKEICSTIRVVSMAIAWVLLRQLYEIGFAGFVIVAGVCLVWALTVDYEDRL